MKNFMVFVVFYTAIVSTCLADTASPHEIIRDWSRGSTLSMFIDSVDGFDETWLTEIAHTSSGRQYLMFQKLNGDSNTCTPNASESDIRTNVWQFNGQSIQMVEWCLKYSDSDTYYLNAAIKTDDGESWVHDLFTKSEWVEVKQGNESKVRISAKGFSKNWLEAGGNAL
ncbi:hypothetical protein [Shewanella subflava]|uniref:Uncharacterized protein n=1 Tax=Shewanella subflava TaxID=2986476 RepID=A0ABT3I6R3_9GAMM|nr:hypothetical protein [Shewanella subflava]MCW3171669.1 hypothetical protein [Shewanella subflava]